MKNKFLIALLLCSAAFAQTTYGGKVVLGGKLVAGRGGPPAGGGTSITVNLGQTIGSQGVTDTGFGTATPFIAATQFTTPTPSTGTISVTALGAGVENPGAGNWGLAIYTDSANTPSTLVSNCSTFSSTTATVHISTLAPTSCVLSAATKYWVAFITTNNTQTLPLSSKQASSFCDSSPGIQSFITNAGIASFLNVGSWPGTFPASAAGAECIEIFATVQYTVASPTYLFAGKGLAVCAASVTSCTVDVAPLGSAHGLVVGNAAADLSALAILVSSFADSAGDTITRRGTCTGTTTISDALCIGSVDQATAGTNTITVNYAGTALAGAVAYAEIIGTASSSSFDQVQYDTVRLATPFTSGNTPSTTQANEVVFGIADNTLASSTFTAGGSWSLLGQATTATGNNMTVGWFTKTVSSTGAQNLQGSYGAAGTTNLPGLGTFK